MTTQTSTRPTRSTTHALGALGSALAVAVVGVGALPAGEAQAAGIRTTATTPASVTRAIADPAAATLVGSTTTRSFVVRGTRLVAV